MGIIDGGEGSIEGIGRFYTREKVLINFTFEPKGVKKSLDDICKARRISDKAEVELCRQEADSMVRDKFMCIERNGQWIFSRDNEGYYWKKASFVDKCIHYCKRLVNAIAYNV